jgi:ERCC4-related helicase
MTFVICYVQKKKSKFPHMEVSRFITCFREILGLMKVVECLEKYLLDHFVQQLKRNESSLRGAEGIDFSSVILELMRYLSGKVFYNLEIILLEIESLGGFTSGVR